jgi:hypothetical protein
MATSPSTSEEEFARWLATHPRATLLEIAAFLATRDLLAPPARR